MGKMYTQAASLLLICGSIVGQQINVRICVPNEIESFRHRNVLSADEVALLSQTQNTSRGGGDCFELVYDRPDPNAPFLSIFDIPMVQFSRGGSDVPATEAGLRFVFLEQGDFRKHLNHSTVHMQSPSVPVWLKDLRRFEAGSQVAIGAVVGQDTVRRYFRLDPSIVATATLPGEPVLELTAKPNRQAPFSNYLGTIEVAHSYKGNLLSAADVGLRKIKVILETGEMLAEREFTLQSAADHQRVKVSLSLEKLEEFRPIHGTPIQVVVQYKDGLPDQIFYAKALQRFSGYGSTKLGLWLPLALFGTTFQRTTDTTGVEMSALPVNLAIGARLNWGRSQLYSVGGSIIASYEVRNIPDLGGRSGQSSYLLNGLSLGALLELNELVYIGVSKPVFSTGNSSSSLAFVFGFTPKLLGILTTLEAPKD